MSTATHGSRAQFKLADAGDVLQDITSYLTSNGLTDTLDMAESSHLGDTDKEYVAGLGDRTFDIGGNLDPTIDGHIWGIRRMVKAFEYYPLGQDLPAGQNVKYAGNCIIQEYAMSGGVSALQTFTMKAQVAGSVTRSLV